MGQAQGTVRNQSIEALRIVAAFGVVAFHGKVSPVEAYYGGLVVFLALSPMFEMGANFARKRSAAELATTFLVPFAFWFPIYGLVNLAKGKPVLIANDALGLFAGTSIHLWFLPFMFAVLFVLNRFKYPSFRVPLFVAANVAMLALTSPLWKDQPGLAQAPVGQWLHASAAVCAGIAIGLSRGSVRMTVVTAALIAVAVASLWFQADPLFSPLAYSVGLSALLIALFVPVRWPANLNVAPLSACMMVVYLMHPLALTVFNVVLGKGTFATSLAAFVACSIATFVLREAAPWLRPVLLAQRRPVSAAS